MLRNRELVALIIFFLHLGLECHSIDMKMEMRQVESGPAISYKAMTLQSSGEIYYVASEGEIFEDADIESGRIATDRFGISIEITFSPSGGKKLSAISNALIDKQLGIIVNGQLVWVARVAEPIPGGELRVSGFKRIEEAEDLARMIVGEKLLKHPKNMRTVKVSIKTEIRLANASEAIYLLVRKRNEKSEEQFAIDLLRELMTQRGYSVKEMSELKPGDLEKIIFFQVDVEGIEFESMTIVLTHLLQFAGGRRS
jgi:hypothetical protein